MRHRRGVELAPFQPAIFREFDGYDFDTIRILKEWEVLGAKCGICGKTVWLDKSAFIQRYGNQYLRYMGSKLRCTCGNREGNRVLIGKLGRD